MEHFQLVFDCSKKLEAQSDMTATAPKKKKREEQKRRKEKSHFTSTRKGERE